MIEIVDTDGIDSVGSSRSRLTDYFDRLSLQLGEFRRQCREFKQLGENHRIFAEIRLWNNEKPITVNAVIPAQLLPFLLIIIRCDSMRKETTDEVCVNFACKQLGNSLDSAHRLSTSF